MQKKIKLFTPHEPQKKVIQTLLDREVKVVTLLAGRRIGKTILAENMAIYWAINDPNCIVYWVSPSDSQAHKIYQDILKALRNADEIKSNKGKMGDTQIIFNNGSKILFRSAKSEDTLRGEGVNYLILDEAAFIKDMTYIQILEPMLATDGKKTFIITTPKGKNWIHKMYLRGLPQSDTYPYYTSFRFSSEDSPYVKKDVIERKRKELPEKIFQQEYLAEFVDSSSVFNNLREIMLLEPIKTPEPNDTYWAGIDIGLITDASVLTILNKEGNMVAYYRWNKIESPDLIAEIVKLNTIWNFKTIMMENNNQGLTIFQELKRKINNIVDFNTNQKTKPEIINRLIHLFNMKEMLLIDDEYLEEELGSFIFKQTDTGAIKFQADTGAHDDVVMSLAIARKCWEDSNKIFGDAEFIGFF